jgi:hypothetical protein
MAFNGSGTFNRIYNWVNDKANGFKITASRMDGEFDGIATGLSQCITKDGQTTITANIPLNNYKLTGAGNGAARTDVINVGQVQDNQFQYLGTTGGTADAYTLTPSPTITAYATTQQITAKINATNLTTTPYLQVSGIANPASTAVIKKLNASKAEIAVEASDLLIYGIYDFQRNSANDAWIILNPEKAFYNGANLSNLPAATAATTTQGVAFLSNPITIANNASNPNTQMDIGAGNVDYDNGSGQLVCQAITKTLQSTGSWTAGTNQNGLDTGARANSTLYHIFQIVKNSDNTSDILYSTSRTAPAVPSGYTLVAWVGSIRTNASGNIDQNYLAEKTEYGQISFYKNSTYSSGSTLLPIDNTIPQNSEGDQYLSIDFIPLSSKSTLEININATLGFSSTGTITMALFQDSGANAICVKPAGFISSSGAMIGAFMQHIFKSTSTSLTTFKFRAGNVNAGTTYFNGNGSALFGGTLFSSITIKEFI